MIPFTRTDFMRVFEQYNDAVWPWHVLIYLAGLIAFAPAFTRRTIASKLICLILALLWLWMGVVYHLLFFTTINKAARLFGALFIVQSLVFIFAGVLRSRLSFSFRFNVQGLIGGALMTYAVIVYPIIGIALGHSYPAAPTFGVPCPTTIFTFGLLIGAGINIRFYMLIIPLLWSLIGLWAAISLGMYEDLGLAVAGLISVRYLAKSHVRTGDETKVQRGCITSMIHSAFQISQRFKNGAERRWFVEEHGLHRKIILL